MTELGDRLQGALGSGYRVEKELGGGGMSRVFLAEEVELGRRVVVKLLPPDMAAGVNVDRFRREIQLAARLQHPHIVPLLTAGSSDDLLYYVMPFIEGESLRAKLSREGELPVPEALRILRDVLDALAYAHGQHVVHRDIKPDNVMISGKHALVTDFGVAKAVAESTGKTALTSMGVALGTPAYMAPEQATADPHTDHRADIYAAGALAYEMLCGRPPFTGMNAQAVLAAHVTEAPDPVLRHREAVPAALNELVMRCLKKKPADRWQRADEVLPHLEAILTPTGGITPTGTQPVISSGTQTAIDRAHPVRVAALFGLASVGVLAIVYAAVQLIGLPDWVFYGAIALLGVGLPIVLLTGHHERRRALARTTGAVVTTPSTGLKGLFTWRRALLGGGVAFAALGLVTAGYMAMRVLGIGPVGTLVATGVLERGDQIILADFLDRTGDTTLATTVTEALRVDLAQSPTFRLLPADALRAALARMGRAADTTLGVELAREVAVREGVKAVVTGEIHAAGGGYLLSAQLAAPETGNALVAHREAAADAGEIIAAIDRLSKKLRERIGESLKSIRANPPLDRVTTRSLEALRKYTQAIRAEEQGEIARQISLLEEAIALDSGFAMAHRRLAVGLSNAFADPSRIIGAATQAYEHRDRLPEYERHHVVAFYFMRAEDDPEQAIAAYRSALELDSTDRIALNNLALQLNELRRFAEAESLAERGLELHNVNVLYTNAMWAQVGQGKYAEAEATVRLLAERSPGVPFEHALRGHLAGARRDFEAAAREYELAAGSRTELALQAITQGARAAARQVQGRLRLSEGHARRSMAAEEARGVLAGYLRAAIELALIDLRYRNAPDAAVREIEGALERHPLATMPATDRPYSHLAYFYAQAGRVAEAKRLLWEYEAAVEPRFRWQDNFRHAADGAVALAEGRLQDASTAFRTWNETGRCTTCGLFELARAYERAEQPDSALAAYERAVSTPGLFRLFDEYYTLGPSYQRVGELYEQRGDRVQALDYYGRFVELWRDADPELQPLVREVRDRMARLVGEQPR